jgi:G:T-mismatch repair DNA endonuclease (very short patch repair protein)
LLLSVTTAEEVIIVVFVTGCLLGFNLAMAVQQPTAADQKWLAAVEKMVSKGSGQISTPSES